MPGIVFAILTIVGMAAFTLLLRGALEFWPVGTTGILSRIVTLMLLGGWVLGTRSGWRRLIPGGMGRQLLLMGAISIVINLFLFGSLRFTTATNHALLYRLDLIFVVLIGAAWGIERIGWSQLALLPVMLAGVTLVLDVQHFQWQGHFIGDAMAVAAAFGFAVNAFIIRRILRKVDEAATALYNHGISTLGFMGLAWWQNEWPRAAQAAMSSSAWVRILALGVVTAAVLPLYYAALHRMQVWKLRAWLLLTPVTVALVEWLLWETHLNAWQYLGSLLVLSGLGGLIWLELRTQRGVS